MNVISRRTLRTFAGKHAHARVWLENWYRTALAANWKNLDDVRLNYRAADQVAHCLVFNKGNDYRLIVRVVYADDRRRGTLFVKRFLTHAEYDKDRWKGCCQ